MFTMNAELQSARERAEKTIGIKLPDNVCEKVLAYTRRKLEVIEMHEKKPEGYLAILFENELLDHCTRTAINLVSAMCREVAYAGC